MSSKSRSGVVHSIQLYVIKFVSDLRQVSGFLRVLRFSPPIKLTATKILLKRALNTITLIATKILLKRALNTITLINTSLYSSFCLKKKSCIKILDKKHFFVKMTTIYLLMRICYLTFC